MTAVSATSQMSAGVPTTSDRSAASAGSGEFGRHYQQALSASVSAAPGAGYTGRTDYNANGTLWTTAADGTREWIGGTPVFGAPQIAQYLDLDADHVAKQVGFQSLPSQWRAYDWNAILNTEDPLATIKGLRGDAFNIGRQLPDTTVTSQQLGAREVIQTGNVGAVLSRDGSRGELYRLYDDAGVALTSVSAMNTRQLEEAFNRYGIDGDVTAQFRALAAQLEARGVQYAPGTLFQGSDAGVDLDHLATQTPSTASAPVDPTPYLAENAAFNGDQTEYRSTRGGLTDWDRETLLDELQERGYFTSASQVTGMHALTLSQQGYTLDEAVAQLASQMNLAKAPNGAVARGVDAQMVQTINRSLSTAYDSSAPWQTFGQLYQLAQQTSTEQVSNAIYEAGYHQGVLSDDRYDYLRNPAVEVEPALVARVRDLLATLAG
ncbi:hypothetical protein EQG41_11225 [Billgrantia azerbaijanica]|nr:hypothetical protein EQG41_11225 [Halomonas azerbaijanica]